MNGNFWTIQIDISLLATVLLCLTPLVWAYFVMRRTLNERRARSKSPFSELRRRPAGEGVRLKVAALDDQINELISLLISLPVASVPTCNVG